jgi:sterol desaturase/sphingolipid hydroxylase (fatty acid hydroxylase superfamily)
MGDARLRRGHAKQEELRGMNALNTDFFVRFGFFAGVFLLMAAAELLAPRRRLTANKPRRWLSNLALVGINALMLRLVLPLGAAGVAVLVLQRGWGLFNNVAVPNWAAIVIAIVALDFVIYLQHVLFHAVPLLWRLHRVHHADLDIDVSTGLRFHTVEILVSMLIKLAAVVLLGPPPVAVLAFEVLLNATAMFNHSNVRLPLGLDRVLRLLLVTPDMHRVHHSAVSRETNSNFGFNLPWWDLLLGTYRAQPAAGHESMTIGLAAWRDERVTRLDWMLAAPLLGPAVETGAGEDAAGSTAAKRQASAITRRQSTRQPAAGGDQDAAAVATF